MKIISELLGAGGVGAYPGKQYQRYSREEGHSQGNRTYQRSTPSTKLPDGKDWIAGTTVPKPFRKKEPYLSSAFLPPFLSHRTQGCPNGRGTAAAEQEVAKQACKTSCLPSLSSWVCSGMMKEERKKQRKSTTALKAYHAVPAANESRGDRLAEGEKVCKEPGRLASRARESV